MTYQVLAEALRDPAKAGGPAAFRDFLSHEHPADLAAFVGALPPKDAWTVLDLVPIDKQALVFGYLDHDFQVDLALIAPRAKVAGIVTQMNADERADLFDELSEEQREALFPALAHAEREDIRRLASYPESTAGAIMTSDYATLTEGLSATEALEKLRREAPEKETIYRTYVIDAERRLIGSVRLQDLILAPARALVGQIMERNTLAVRVDEDQEEVARQIAKYDILALPVVDGDSRLVGIVTHDDATDVLQEEATEDFHKVGAATGLETSLREASIWMLYRARIAWLIVLIFANIFSGAGLAYFEHTIVAYVTLLFFLPLLIASGGNAGSQSATMMVRALAIGDVRIADWGWMIGRELFVAALLGATMALAVSTLGVIRGGFEIGMIVAASMIAIVIVGSLIGMTLPFVLTKLGQDPAAASTPLVTSIADVVGVLIYFTIATAVLFPSA
jgi:magnesium transporter